MTAHPTPTSLVQQLDQASIAYEFIDHPRTTTAAAEAHVLGLERREVLERSGIPVLLVPTVVEVGIGEVPGGRRREPAIHR